MAEVVPTEAREQMVVVQYLRLRNVPHFRVPNETYTKSWRQKANNKALGVVPGVPDLFAVPGNTLIAIEMKRRKGSSTTQSQKEWLEVLNAAGIEARVCKGADEAIEFIDKFLPEQPTEFSGSGTAF